MLDNIAPGLQVLADQRTQFTAMLDALNRLSSVTVSTLDASKDDIVADLDQLAPILSQLAAAGSALPQSLQVLLTYPFPDTVLQAIRGDYFSGFIVINLNTTQADIDATNPGATAAPARIGLPSSPSATVLGTTPVDPPPSLLPATSSASPGLPSSTVANALPLRPAEVRTRPSPSRNSRPKVPSVGSRRVSGPLVSSAVAPHGTTSGCGCG